MGKAKRAAKRARRKAKGTADEVEYLKQEQDVVRRSQTRRYVLIGVPILTAAVALGLWLGLDDERLAGVAILLGAVVFLLYALGTLGGSVEPRDRDKAGAIDFGTRKR